jgi:hypothetical protein
MRDEEIRAIRKVRHEISRKCGHEIHKVAEYYRSAGKALRQSGQLPREKGPDAKSCAEGADATAKT